MRTVLVLSDDRLEKQLLAAALERGGRWQLSDPHYDLGSRPPDELPGLGALSAKGGPGWQPDVAIVDLEMEAAPRLVELARQSWPACALVVRSGREPGEVDLARKAAGAIGFLHEDLDASTLGQELERLLALVGRAELAMRPDQQAPGHETAGQGEGDGGPAGGAVRRRLGAHPLSAAEARRTVKASLHSWDLEGFADDAALLVTELVANAVRHAGSEVEVSVVLRPASVRVEVVDFVPSGLVEAVQAADDAEGGRGLAIVESLASRWGVSTHARGKTVWFELDRSRSA
ncbi:MAG: ATP-binding protein [Acidimicrobiales bacterium]